MSLQNNLTGARFSIVRQLRVRFDIIIIFIFIPIAAFFAGIIDRAESVFFAHDLEVFVVVSLLGQIIGDGFIILTTDTPFKIALVRLLANFPFD